MNLTEEGQLEDAPPALDVEPLMLAHGRCAALAGMQPVLHREKARTEIDHVLAVFLGDLVEAVVHLLQALELNVSAEEIGPNGVGLEFGEEDAGAAVQVKPAVPIEPSRIGLV